MTNFNIKIDTPDGLEYHLRIQSLNKGLNESDIIQLFIAISKQAGKKHQISDTLAVRFNLATHTYKAIEKLKGTAAILYDKIIEILDRTFGRQWGYLDEGLYI